jgi:drug/metabolite transporter (DMT)-like permease
VNDFVEGMSMRDWISALLAVLGALMVLAGGTITVVKTVTPEPVSDTASGNALIRRFRKLNGADRLVLWGVVLLLLAAIAADAISFNFGAEAGTR